MKQRNNPTWKHGRLLRYLILADLVSFIVYFTAAALHVPEVKFFAGISTLLLAALCIVILYKFNEVYRQRSFWITVSAVSIAACTLLSLLLGYPSPNPLNNTIPQYTNESTEYTEFIPAGWQTEATEAPASSAEASGSRYDTPTEYPTIEDSVN